MKPICKLHLNAIFDIIMYTVYFLITVYTNKITNLYNDKEAYI